MLGGHIRRRFIPASGLSGGYGQWEIRTTARCRAG